MSCPLNSESFKKNGVKRVEVSADHEGQRIDNFLARHLKGVPKAAIYRMIRTGQVRINGKRCKPVNKVSRGDEVRIPPARTNADGTVRVSDAVLEQVHAAILFEDDDYLVINKPSGMAVHAGSNLPWGLIDALRQARPGQYVELAHRLDRETSGCVALAKSGPALRHLSDQFRGNTITKHYLCLMDGRLKEARVEVDAPLRRCPGASEHQMEVHEEGKSAVTRFRLLQAFADCSYVEAELLTGRTHQIRAHAAHLGLPLAGDERYSSKTSLEAWKARGLRRLFLHAHDLRFASISGASLAVNAPLPPPLREVLERLEN